MDLHISPHHAKLWSARARRHSIPGKHIHVVGSRLYRRLWCVVGSDSKKWRLATSSPGTGMQIGMYLNCASYLWKQRHSSQGKYAFFRLAYITLLLILETVVVATSMRVLLLMYTDHLDYPGGPLAWFLASAQPFDSTVFASLFLLTSFSDLLVVRTYTQFLHLYSQLYLALALLGHLESYREASRLHRFMCSGSLTSLFYG